MSREPIEKTWLFREIHEQPAALARLLASEGAAVKELAAAIKSRPVRYVVIAARGTSDNAARYANYLLGAMNGLTVALATPSLFSIYRRPPRLADALVLGISQSGKSPDIVAVLAEARRQGALTAVLTNESDSDLANQGDVVIRLNAGEERAVAATKTYTTELAAIAWLSATLAGDASLLSAVERVPEAVGTALQLNDAIATAVPRYRYMERCVVIGRGYNYATAFELALKMKELTYVVVEPYSSADFQHGPLALLEHGFPVIVLAPDGAMNEEMAGFMRTVAARQAELIALSDRDEILAHAQTPLRLPLSMPEWLSPVTTVVPGQLFAMHLAYTRGYDVDTPRGIRKVTETR
jgi:glutamine---fructose-6-phosphate transaminase (isomerizing)